MRKAKKLMKKCKSMTLHCSINYQSITDYSVEIYRGYETNYKEVFYTDGHTKPKRAIKKALKFLKTKK